MSMKGDQSSASSELTGVRVTQAGGATVSDRSKKELKDFLSWPASAERASSTRRAVGLPCLPVVWLSRAPRSSPCPTNPLTSDSLPSADGQFFYVASARKDEKVHTSETFPRRTSAINAARREHEGRNEKYDYLLDYENNKDYLVGETL